MSELSDIVGHRFGRLLVVRLHSRYFKDSAGVPHHARWWCVCDCGVEKSFVGYTLKNGDTQSCGCYGDERRLKHGLSRTPIYAAWVSIRSRILNENDENFSNYGGRGLTMEVEWEDDFLAFYKYVHDSLGDRPSDEFSLDRCENDLGYLKGNLRWATRVQQANNRRTNLVITFKGITCTLVEHCRLLGLNYQTIKNRLHTLGWGVEDALSIPIRPKRAKAI